VNLALPLQFRLPLLMPLLAVVAFTVGCAPSHPPLPTYPRMDAQATLRRLAQRTAMVRTVSAACLLTLTRANGESVRLDGAIAMRVPSDVRLQAFKFGQKVFDLTLTKKSLWLETPEDSRHRSQILPAGTSAAQLARGLSLFGGRVFEGSGVEVTEFSDQTIVVRKPLEGGQTMTATVDRPTLTVREYRLFDPQGRRRFSLKLDDYREFNQIVWPTRITAVSESGRINADLNDVTLNGELPAAAFIPPRRAQRVP
jgi:outer membrane lipoprotein-sorting protein